jgi:uncharacterized protein YfdQ (DUF2303 family)
MPKETILPDDQAIDKLLAAGRAMGTPITEHKGIPLIIIPKGYQLETLEAFLPPQRIEECPRFTDVESFSRYVKRFAVEATTLFAIVGDANFNMLAVLDYHAAADKPAWASHRALLALMPTGEWVHWMASNGVKRTQGEFALFLEENERLFRSPSGADLREMVLMLEGKCDARFNSAIRLQNGQVRMSYVEDVELRGSHGEAAGMLELPGEFICGIAPFEGMAAYEVKARLRYRLEDRKITFWYETITPHLIVRDAAKLALDRVQELTGIEPLIGCLN